MKQKAMSATANHVATSIRTYRQSPKYIDHFATKGVGGIISVRQVGRVQRKHLRGQRRAAVAVRGGQAMGAVAGR